MGSVSKLVRPKILPFDPNVAAKTEYPITTYQPTYFAAESMNDLKGRMKHFCDTMARPFFPTYDPLTQNIIVGKAIKLADRVSTAELQAKKQAEYFEAKQKMTCHRHLHLHSPYDYDDDNLGVESDDGFVTELIGGQATLDLGSYDAGMARLR